MRFPLALTVKIARHIIKHKLRKTPRFALVLQLEPLHTCNLTCTGCGRIREYSTSLKDMMALEDCLGSAQECDAPMVSICGGEPLIYPKIKELVAGLLDQGRIVYVCTNGMFMRRELKDYLASIYSPTVEPTLTRLLAEKLISEKDAETIRKGKTDGRPAIKPTKWMYWNVHIDGLEYTHDLIVEREGVFQECVQAIRMAKILGYQVATNTTVYKETDAREIEQMFEFFSSLEVDAHTISPGYEYDAAKKDMVKRLGRKPEDFFLTRAMTREKFKNILDWGRRFTIIGTPVYQEFLAGKRELTCTAWAIPTRNIKGWKAPCYLMTDGHYGHYQEMLDQVDWNKYGVVDGVARDPRCENCMVHCGYDPSGALSSAPADTWKNMKYNFESRPKPYYEGRNVDAFNGFSAGKGHLAEAKAAVKSGLAGAKSAFQNNAHSGSNGNGGGGSCRTGDTSQRDELLTKIREPGPTRR
ncbi:MAG TPA: adenosyl-hopene transferase HpnH [Candidatus Acidoferrum sp.]|jgi:MoaA/NifB/PqqE/SkfB family radical SAM enzyme|nr:adenosyl-hopene transferase HpnH [Candidatus Acidoferrum sp.]